MKTKSVWEGGEDVLWARPPGEERERWALIKQAKTSFAARASSRRVAAEGNAGEALRGKGLEDVHARAKPANSVP